MSIVFSEIRSPFGFREKRTALFPPHPFSWADPATTSSGFSVQGKFFPGRPSGKQQVAADRNTGWRIMNPWACELLQERKRDFFYNGAAGHQNRTAHILTKIRPLSKILTYQIIHSV